MWIKTSDNRLINLHNIVEVAVIKVLNEFKVIGCTVTVDKDGDPCGFTLEYFKTRADAQKYVAWLSNYLGTISYAIKD